MINQTAYLECLSKTDDVVINLVGLRHDIDRLPYPFVLSIYTRAINDLKAARMAYLMSCASDAAIGGDDEKKK